MLIIVLYEIEFKNLISKIYLKKSITPTDREIDIILKNSVKINLSNIFPCENCLVKLPRK